MKKIIDFFKKIKQKIGDFLFKNRFGTIMVLTGIIVAFWDFTTKFLFDGQEYPALKGVFSIFSTHNTGGAWSIFANATWLLILFSILFIIGIVVFNYFLKTKTYFYAISMGILLSGAICNLYDRIAFGYVRDFIKLDFMNFPIFNIADIAICVGVALIAIYFIFIAPKLEKKQRALEKENLQQISILEETTQENDTTKEVISQEDNETVNKNEENTNKETLDKNETKAKKTTQTKKSNSNSKSKTQQSPKNTKQTVNKNAKGTTKKSSNSKAKTTQKVNSKNAK